MSKIRLEPAFFLFMVLLSICCDVAKTDGTEKDMGKCKPHAIHLTFGKTSKEMLVIWETEGECTSVVQYASHPWHLNHTATGKGVQLDCEKSNSTKFLHQVKLEHLHPGDTVYYRIISNSTGNGAVYFKVPNLDEPSRFIIFNELQQTQQKKFVTSVSMQAYSHAFTGLFYLSEPVTLISEKNGESFQQMLRNPAINIPLMLAAEWGSGPDSQCGRQMFPSPGSFGPASSTPKWFSHDVGPVHIVRYSSRVFLEADTKEAKAMQAWMVDDLTKVNQMRSQTPWVIAMGLDPMYCSPSSHSIADCSRNDSKIRYGLEDIFYGFAVDLVIEQQDGPYERTWPHYKGVVVAKSYVTPSAPVELIMGLGKTPVQKAEQTNSSESYSADWSAFRSYYGGESYGRLTVANKSHLHWELLSTSGDSILDEVWLVQPQHGNFSLSSLPRNVSHQINQSIIALGGKPGTYDFIGNLSPDQNAADGEGWSKYSLWFGLAIVGAALGIGLGTVTIRSYVKRRRGNSGRRWQEVDRHGSGGHFYSVASDSDTDDDNENDFEIDMFERSSKSGSKLLTSY